ncbi:MAG: 2-oxoacid ferredoxin oxidoreductase [Chloroflexi bacterium]|nr:2-oxoacid ferredoxin oxidoreductase [Chloroflexota bacterium]
MSASLTVLAKDYKQVFSEEITWCAGCGDYGVLAGLQQALAGLAIPPHRVMVSSGIGCGSKLPDYIKANGWQTLHGRALPNAQGFKLAHHEMTVLAVTGDGDGIGEGGNHWLHAMRRNVNFTHLLQDNQTYGLTKGQVSPTAPTGFIGGTTPEGSLEAQANPLAIALATGATFVARAFSGDVKHLVQVIQAAIQHRGYSLVDILQPCVTWNRHEYSYDWFRKRVYKLEPEHDISNLGQASQRSLEWGDRIPTGIFFQTERLTFDEQLPAIRMDPEHSVALRPLAVDAEQFERLKARYI